MVTVDLAPIRKAIDQALTAATRRVAKEQRQNATSLGLSLDLRSATVKIALNDDDDEAFQCGYIEDFNEPNWVSKPLPTLTGLENKLLELDPSDENPQLTVLGEQAEATLDTIEEFCRHVYPFGLGWVTAWYQKQPPTMWRPVRLIFEEPTAGSAETLRVSPCQPLPTARPKSREPLITIGLPPPKQGLKVFALAHRERKYGSMYSRDYKTIPKLLGEPASSLWPQPHEVLLQPEGAMKGDLAVFGRNLAYLQKGSHADMLNAFFSPYFEKLPAWDGKDAWTVIHALEPRAVLDARRTKFQWSPYTSISRVDYAEFDAGALRALARPVFRLSEDIHLDSLFLESSVQPGFLSLCDKEGLRGVTFRLIWCEDLSEFLPKFEEYMDRVTAYVRRVTGSASIRRMKETLHHINKDLWSLGAFRELFNKSGAEKALNSFPEISSFIRSLAPIAPSRGSTSNNPFSKEEIAAVDQFLSGKELLHEVTGRLCHNLPQALGQLQQLEKSRS